MSRVGERYEPQLSMRIFCLVLLSLSALYGRVSLAGQETGRLRLRVQGLDGATPKGRRGRAFPLVLHADNRSGAALRGLVQIYWTENSSQSKARQRIFHNRRVELSPGERRLLLCPEMPLDPQDRSLVVSLRLDEGDSPAPLSFEPQIMEHGLSVLWTSDRGEAKSGLFGEQRAAREGYDPVHVTSLRPEDLPASSWAYEAFDVLFIADSELADMDGARLRALRSFVAAGGTLIFAPGDLPGQIQRSPLADLLPVEARSASAIEDRSLPALSPLLPTNGPGQVRVHALKPRPAAEVIASDGPDCPLIVARSFGAGKVFVIAFSLNSAALQKWGGRATMLLRLCPAGPRTGIGRLAEAPWLEWAMNRTSKASDMEPPGLLLLGPLLLLYALFVAPLSARFSRTERAGLRFFTLALTLVFAVSGLVWLLTSWSRPGAGLILEAELIRLPARPLSQDEKFPEASYERVLGLFQAQSGSLSAEVEDQRIAILRGESPILTADFEERGEGRSLRRMRGGAGTFRRGFERGARPLGGVSAELELEQDIICGEILNSSRLSLRDGIVVFGGQVASLEPLKPGERRPLRLPLYALSPESKGSEAFLKASVDDSSSYFRYFPLDTIETDPLSARQRLVEMLRVEGLEALRSAPASVVLFALAEDPDSSEPSRWGLRRRPIATLVRVELPLRFTEKGLRLSSLPAFFRGNHEPLTYDGKRLGYEIQGAELLGENDPLSVAVFEFPLPAGLPENWNFTELSFEGTFFDRLGLGKAQLQFWEARRQQWGQVYDFSASHDASANTGLGRLKLKSNEPREVLDLNTGRVIVRVRNNGQVPVIVSEAFLRLQGGPARR